MQRTFVVITLAALALTGVMGAGYQASSYAKAPIPVVQNTETNFTSNATLSKLGLTSFTSGELCLTASTTVINATSHANSNWTVYAKKLEAKALTSTTPVASPLLYNFSGTSEVIYVNNYAVSLDSDVETGNTSLRVYQQPITGGAPLPRLTYSNNTIDTTFIVKRVTQQVIGKVVYIFYQPADKIVNITSFTVGGAFSTSSITLTSNYTDGLQVVWGEALGTSKLFAMWREGTTLLKDSVVDLTKSGNATANTVVGYANSTYHACFAYVTDKTLYGEICTAPNTTETNKSLHTTIYWVRTANNASNLVTFATYNLSGPSYIKNYPYGPYLILDFADTSNASANLRSYELWNFDNSSLCKPRTLYLQIDTTVSTSTNFRVVSGGLYTLLYDISQTNKTDGTRSYLSEIQVGLLLGSSNLASVLGFLLTIIAGLLLF